jgi:hypothetical protein
MVTCFQVQLGEMPESDSIIVEQLHLTTWPDHGVPSTTSNLLGKSHHVARSWRTQHHI